MIHTQRIVVDPEAAVDRLDDDGLAGAIVDDEVDRGRLFDLGDYDRHDYDFVEVRLHLLH